jgi:phosphoglycolate phosphatase-like HAD superfamily hydrolase
MERLVLFDIDGTLTRTQNGYLPFNDALLKTFGVAGDIRSVVPDGNTDPLIVEEIFAAARPKVEITAEQWEGFAARLGDSYLAAFSSGAATVTALPGVSELLRALTEEARIDQSVVTGNFETVARIKLETAGLHAYLCRGAYASDSRHRADLPAIAKARWEKAKKRSIGCEQCIVVGDTAKDLAAARDNGMKCVLVGTGRYPIEELALLEPDGCLPDLTDTRAAIDLLLKLF